MDEFVVNIQQKLQRSLHALQVQDLKHRNRIRQDVQPSLAKSRSSKNIGTEFRDGQTVAENVKYTIGTEPFAIWFLTTEDSREVITLGDSSSCTSSLFLILEAIDRLERIGIRPKLHNFAEFICQQFYQSFPTVVLKSSEKLVLPSSPFLRDSCLDQNRVQFPLQACSRYTRFHSLDQESEQERTETVWLNCLVKSYESSTGLFLIEWLEPPASTYRPMNVGLSTGHKFVSRRNIRFPWESAADSFEQVQASFKEEQAMAETRIILHNRISSHLRHLLARNVRILVPTPHIERIIDLVGPVPKPLLRTADKLLNEIHDMFGLVEESLAFNIHVMCQAVLSHPPSLYIIDTPPLHARILGTNPFRSHTEQWNRQLGHLRQRSLLFNKSAQEALLGIQDCAQHIEDNIELLEFDARTMYSLNEFHARLKQSIADGGSSIQDAIETAMDWCFVTGKAVVESGVSSYELISKMLKVANYQLETSITRCYRNSFRKFADQVRDLTQAVEPAPFLALTLCANVTEHQVQPAQGALNLHIVVQDLLDLPRQIMQSITNYAPVQRGLEGMLDVDLKAMQATQVLVSPLNQELLWNGTELVECGQAMQTLVRLFQEAIDISTGFFHPHEQLLHEYRPLKRLQLTDVDDMCKQISHYLSYFHSRSLPQPRFHHNVVLCNMEMPSASIRNKVLKLRTHFQRQLASTAVEHCRREKRAWRHYLKILTREQTHTKDWLELRNTVAELETNERKVYSRLRACLELNWNIHEYQVELTERESAIIWSAITGPAQIQSSLQQARRAINVLGQEHAVWLASLEGKIQSLSHGLHWIETNTDDNLITILEELGIDSADLSLLVREDKLSSQLSGVIDQIQLRYRTAKHTIQGMNSREEAMGLETTQVKEAVVVLSEARWLRKGLKQLQSIAQWREDLMGPMNMEKMRKITLGTDKHEAQVWSLVVEFYSRVFCDKCLHENDSVLNDIVVEVCNDAISEFIKHGIFFDHRPPLEEPAKNELIDMEAEWVSRRNWDRSTLRHMLSVAMAYQFFSQTILIDIGPSNVIARARSFDSFLSLSSVSSSASLASRMPAHSIPNTHKLPQLQDLMVPRIDMTRATVSRSRSDESLHTSAAATQQQQQQQPGSSGSTYRSLIGIEIQSMYSFASTATGTSTLMTGRSRTSHSSIRSRSAYSIFSDRSFASRYEPLGYLIDSPMNSARSTADPHPTSLIGTLALEHVIWFHKLRHILWPMLHQLYQTLQFPPETWNVGLYYTLSSIAFTRMPALPVYKTVPKNEYNALEEIQWSRTLDRARLAPQLNFQVWTEESAPKVERAVNRLRYYYEVREWVAGEFLDMLDEAINSRNIVKKVARKLRSTRKISRSRASSKSTVKTVSSSSHSSQYSARSRRSISSSLASSRSSSQVPSFVITPSSSEVASPHSSSRSSSTRNSSTPSHHHLGVNSSTMPTKVAASHLPVAQPKQPATTSSTSGGGGSSSGSSSSSSISSMGSTISMTPLAIIGGPDSTRVDPTIDYVDSPPDSGRLPHSSGFYGNFGSDSDDSDSEGGSGGGFGMLRSSPSMMFHQMKK